MDKSKMERPTERLSAWKALELYAPLTDEEREERGLKPRRKALRARPYADRGVIVEFKDDVIRYVKGVGLVTVVDSEKAGLHAASVETVNRELGPDYKPPEIGEVEDLTKMAIRKFNAIMRAEDPKYRGYVEGPDFECPGAFQPREDPNIKSSVLRKARIADRRQLGNSPMGLLTPKMKAEVKDRYDAGQSLAQQAWFQKAGLKKSKKGEEELAPKMRVVEQDSYADGFAGMARFWRIKDVTKGWSRANAIPVF